MAIHTQASSPVFTVFTTLAPGRRHSVPGRSGDYVVEILPFGPGNSYAHAFFREPDGPAFDSLLLLPEDIQEAARDGFPLSHLEPGAAVSSRSTRETAKPEEVLKKVREAARQSPAEARPEEKDPEAVQSPAEAGVFNSLRSQELVKATLGKIFGDDGPKLKPGSLVDGTYLEDDVSRPLREVVYFVTPDGRPILLSFFNVFYGANKLPVLIVTRTLESLESSHYRKILVEETQKSSSLAAGLSLALTAPTQMISSGPRPGDKVHSRGSATSVGFDVSFVKTYNRLRIEAELKIQDKLGAFKTSITQIPPIGS
ncbi:MAG TPA: hypothetical protein VMW27_12660 [Thermoanaerobaculia bacterium]|nr:hypothetical protein [Thermoanaerobaculia bacterium]